MEIKERTAMKTYREYVIVCDLCGKEITGTSENQIIFLLDIHKKGKKCVGED